MVESACHPSRLAEHASALDKLLASLLVEAPAPPAEDDGVPAQFTEKAPAANPDCALNTAESRPIKDKVSATPAPPTWATGDFRALLFRVGAFRFAMPLVLMRSVAAMPARCVRLPRQPPWQVGLVRYRGRFVTVADLGALVGVDARCPAPRYLLVIGDGGAAVVCDGIEDTHLVQAGQVRWHADRNRRAWLAGLLVEDMCVLLDVNAVADEIRHG